MTKEEKEKAIKALKWFKEYNEEDYCGGDRIQDEHGDWFYRITEQDFETFDKIIKELEKELTLDKEPEPTAKENLAVDCISREQALNEFCIYNSYDSIGVDKVRSYLNALPPVVPQTSRLIPVSERLPNTDDEVLCWYEYYHWSQGKVLPEYGLGCYLKETSSWSGEVASGRDVRAIAWMPLPEAYREIKERDETKANFESEEEEELEQE